MVSESRKRARSRHRPEVCETSSSPCCACRTTGGKIHIHGTRPARVSVKKFGINGKACNACYDRLRLASTPLLPCAACRTPSGESRRPGSRPVRYDGTRFGVDGKVCGRCAKTLRREGGATTGGAGSGPTTCGRPEATYLPPAEEVARAAAAILDSIAERGRAAEARRVAEAYAASRWVSPREASRRAVAEFDSTVFGRKRRQTVAS